MWAPDVKVYNGRTYMYYSVSTFGSKVSLIGLISASSIATGDWRDDGLVIRTTARTTTTPSIRISSSTPAARPGCRSARGIRASSSRGWAAT